MVESPPSENTALPAFFDNHPDIKAKVIEYLKTVSPEEKKKSVDEFYKFVSGEMTWAEIRKISRRMQKELARIAYFKFKMKDYAKAETMFKGLAIIDHTNWYYRAALGAIYQRQKKYEDAVDEYGTALDLKEDEASCFVNRAECFLMMREFDAAKRDLDAVSGLNIPPNSPWRLRSALLAQRLGVARKARS